MSRMLSVADDFEWLSSRYAELQRQYPNMYIAVKGGRVIACGKEFGKVYDEAKAKVGEVFLIEYILSDEPFVLKTNL